MIKTVFELEPLARPSCVSTIENTLNNTEGIYSANVSFSSKMVETQYNENKIEAKQIEEMINDLGFPVLFAKTS
ncbi:heavy-metal-associated domain-containing protein [Oceanobacillus senegalensis]|uniref:heavy-metal-associated domain-containing protein n=1 Tax=Oceanobacillus senegalensis TaxID=1936063 RepID=UPI000A310738|nr:heavy metal-associated domain-containing protein [Oceanobacillus senegalensis]